MLAPSSSQFGGPSSRSSDHCLYDRHSCARPRYLNYKYCAVHIVEDSQSPFTSCEYVSRTTGRKCPNPALRPRNENNLPLFCSEHLHDLIVKEKHQKQKRKLRRKRKNEKSQLNQSSIKRQKLMNKLYKYAEDSLKPQNKLSYGSSDSEVEEVHRPIKDDWLLENASDIATNGDWDDFDPVNNEVYEPLRYADVLTPEEVVATAQSKLIRLQSLYIEQFKRLSHLLKERRRQYLHDRKKELKLEKAAGGYAHRDRDVRDTEEIHALANYRKRTGVEALLRRRQLQLKQGSDGVNPTFPTKSSAQRCTFISHHARCKEFCLPYTKYCTSHILEDPHQQLYRKCRCSDCPIPVCQLTSRPYQIKVNDESENEEAFYCIVHAPLPEISFTFPDIDQRNEMVETEASASQINPLLPETGTGMCDPSCSNQEATEMEVEESLVTSNGARDSDLSEMPAAGKCLECDEKKADILQDLTKSEVASEEQSRIVHTVLDSVGSDHLDTSTFVENKTVRTDISTSPIVVESLGKPSPECDPDSKEDSVEMNAERGALTCENSVQPSALDVPHGPTNEKCKAQESSREVTDVDKSVDQGKLVSTDATTMPGVFPSTEIGESVNISSVKSESQTPVESSLLTTTTSTCTQNSVSEEIGPKEADKSYIPSTTSKTEDEGDDESKKNVSDAGLDHGMKISNDPSESSCTNMPVNKLDNACQSKDDESRCSQKNGAKCPAKLIKGRVHSGSHSPVPAYISRGERKPSSAEEELAVVSLLQLHTGLASDDNATSSSTE